MLASHHHLQAYLLEALRACAWLFIVTFIFVPLEWLFAARKAKLSRKGVLSDLAFYFVSNFVPTLVMAIPLAAAAYVAYRLVPAPWHDEVESWPIWIRGLSAFIVADFGFYWGHR